MKDLHDGNLCKCIIIILVVIIIIIIITDLHRIKKVAQLVLEASIILSFEGRLVYTALYYEQRACLMTRTCDHIVTG